MSWRNQKMKPTLTGSTLLPVLIAAFVGVFVLWNPARATEVPYLTGRITDNAELLNAQTRQQLTSLLAAHESETGNQIAVLTVPTLGGDSIEEYANSVFRAWGLGQKGRDNGVLLLIAPTERRLRIEVGYGLEGQLTDLLAGRIIQNIITPHFKQGDFNEGIREGVQAIVAALNGEKVAGLSHPNSAPSSAGNGNDSFFKGPDLSLPERILFGAFIFGIIGLFTVIGLLTPGIGWLLYFFLIPFWAMFPIVIIGTSATLTVFIIYIIGFPIIKLLVVRTPWYKKAKMDLRTKGHARIGGFTLGGGSSSWSSSSSYSSGGGFSGGGGSSGGGGASGSW